MTRKTRRVRDHEPPPPQREDRALLRALLGDRADYTHEVDVMDPSAAREVLGRMIRQARDGRVRIVVTQSGLAAIARDGLVRVDGDDHVQDCLVVRLAARGVYVSAGSCSCGSVPP
jgi:hypothetical protein